MRTFLDSAVYDQMSHNLTHGPVIVTHEQLRRGAKRIMILNVCIGLGVKFMNPFLMLRQEQVSLGLVA